MQCTAGGSKVITTLNPQAGSLCHPVAPVLHDTTQQGRSRYLLDVGDDLMLGGPGRRCLRVAVALVRLLHVWINAPREHNVQVRRILLRQSHR